MKQKGNFAAETRKTDETKENNFPAEAVELKK